MYLRLIRFLLSLLPVSLLAQNKVLNIEGGKIQGVPCSTYGVTVYKGVPFAAPPIGQLRWKAPQPVVPWRGLKVADRYMGKPWQKGPNKKSIYYNEIWKGDTTKCTEDCLYLNVWAPTASLNNPAAKLPVVMWIHGGAYMNGHAHQVNMDGEAWAKRGVIFVSIEYRLGIFGFLSHPELSKESPHHISGNYGLYDQIAALKWIYNNIKTFGGNPKNITVMGQSAGCLSAKNLVISPLSKGMITHCILESAGGLADFMVYNYRTPSQNDSLGLDIMSKAGYKSLKQMRDADPEELLKINAVKISQPYDDGIALNKKFKQAVLDGEAADIEYLIGYNLDDIRPMNKDVDDFCYARDSLSSKPVYQYLFARKLPGDKLGAFHNAALWYTFGTLNKCWRTFSDADYALADEIMDYWTNFAKTGNPNGASREEWYPFTIKNPYVKTLNIK